ncbi:hypothetical protein [Enterovirga rhinocerotis]|uniref:Uncharacterized protein n=1 Tax=Enterovirga rhinocerotis TaxID=1339210 RepID=A0A4R7BXZ5_9HYPH|nr:hypothetical protein [Enterovirga rhinocerotis]TDR89077.1 hypothetical protein EV668_3562 [Enterovirga rhinocerotis]
MKPALVIAALALLVLAPTEPARAQSGYAAAQTRAGHGQAGRRKARRPAIRPSSAREPGGRCGQLNLERARLYGLCR